MSTYDNQWTLSFDVLNNTTYNLASERGVFLGNGKIGVITNYDNIDTASSMITTQLKYYNGAYRANLTEPFSANRVKFFNNSDTNIVYQNTTQSLNMFTAIFTTTGSITNILNNTSLNMEYDLYTPHNLPFCVMQTIRITPNTDMAEVLMYHDVYTKENITDVEYNNNVVFNDSVNANRGLYILSGKGRISNTNDEIVFASGYVIELADGMFDNLGFNRARSGSDNKCYNTFRLKNLVANQTVRIHIITAHLTSFDFEAPIEEVKRIVLNVTNKASTSAAVAARIRSDHTSAWENLWNTDLVVTPKTGISPSEATALNRLKQSTRYALYTLYSSLRENINVEVNPMNLSVIDFDGSVLYDGDLWLIPLLIMMKPDIARALLEYRFKLIDSARQLASGYGYKGAKYPYINDSVGYKNTLYYEIQGPLSVFNTALISINVWNYFRVTYDRDWLRAKGYIILKDNADFFASKIDKDSDGTYHLRKVVGVNGVESEDQNAFTNNLVRLALKYAIEASYELNYAVKAAWTTNYYNLPILTYPIPLNQVFKSDVDATDATTYNILEPLFNLLPYYSQLFLVPEVGYNDISIKANIDFYEDKTNNTHPFNIALLACLYGSYAQYDSNAIIDYETKLYNFLDENVNGVWGNMGSANDLALNSMLLFMIAQGISKLNIQGGVAETRFYYEEMRVSHLTSANMPATWKNVRVVGGVDETTYTTTNILCYTPP